MDNAFNEAAQPGFSLWLVRHGMNEKAPRAGEPIADGDEGLHLSEAGREEMAALSGWLAGHAELRYPVLIISSSFTRNLEAGRIIADSLRNKGEVRHVEMPALGSNDAV